MADFAVPLPPKKATVLPRSLFVLLLQTNEFSDIFDVINYANMWCFSQIERTAPVQLKVINLDSLFALYA